MACLARFTGAHGRHATGASPAQLYEARCAALLATEVTRPQETGSRTGGGGVGEVVNLNFGRMGWGGGHDSPRVGCARVLTVVEHLVVGGLR